MVIFRGEFYILLKGVYKWYISNILKMRIYKLKGSG